MRVSHMGHALIAGLTARRNAGLPCGWGHAAGRWDGVSRLPGPRPGSGAMAVAIAGLQGVGPADILLDFRRQGANRAFGLVAGAGGAELRRDASDR
jgi:hypothetical protein